MPETEQTPAETDETVTDETASTDPAGSAGSETDEPDPAGSEALGDAGKKALDSMKAKWREERDKRRAQGFRRHRHPRPGHDPARGGARGHTEGERANPSVGDQGGGGGQVH